MAKQIFCPSLYFADNTSKIFKIVRTKIIVMYSVDIINAVLFATYILVAHINFLETHIIILFVAVVLFVDLVMYFPFIASSKLPWLKFHNTFIT